MWFIWKWEVVNLKFTHILSVKYPSMEAVTKVSLFFDKLSSVIVDRDGSTLLWTIKMWFPSKFKFLTERNAVSNYKSTEKRVNMQNSYDIVYNRTSIEKMVNSL